MRYKVWVQVEAQPDDGEPFDVGLPDDIQVFESEHEAFEFVRSLPGWERIASTSDYRRWPMLTVVN
ncbi:MAG TPA: hypothetical protein VF505_14620 [Thermoanaerobaculia bacterium]|jgi:hypothetical protein